MMWHAQKRHAKRQFIKSRRKVAYEKQKKD